jgi:hypothetical protein
MQVRERRLVRDHGTVGVRHHDPPFGRRTLNAFFLMHPARVGQPPYRVSAWRRSAISSSALAALGTLAVLDRLLAGGRPIAMLFGFQHRRRLLLLHATYDRAFAYYSPDNCCCTGVIRRLAAADAIILISCGATWGISGITRGASAPRARGGLSPRPARRLVADIARGVAVGEKVMKDVGDNHMDGSRSAATTCPSPSKANHPRPTCPLEEYVIARDTAAGRTPA